MPQLSAIVITSDEAANIGACLDSLAFCAERIVVDSGSTDATVEIAKQKGARVEFHQWRGYGPQKNYALSLATGDWVLSIDADERVSPELAAAIEAALADPGADGWEFPRLSSFCGGRCGIPAGIPTMCCGSFAAAGQASRTPSCMKA